MMLGFGSLKQMNDTLKHNRDMLSKRKSAREIYKEEIKQRSNSGNNQDLEFLRARVAQKLRRNRIQEVITKILAISLLITIVFGVGFAVWNIDFTWKVAGKYDDKSLLFQTQTYNYANGTSLMIEYFYQGPKAAETMLKNGLKHQHSESFYETGEQFRSALFYNDTLITEIYLYKSGDTIKNFPRLEDDKVHHITLRDNARLKKIAFDFYDGKIIAGTYKENDMN